MRFWQKIFLISLTVLTVAINIIAYMLTGNNHRLNREKELASSREMYSIVVSSFQTNVLYERYRSSEDPFDASRIAQIARGFSYQFALDKLFIQLNSSEGARLFSNFDNELPPQLLYGILEEGGARQLIGKDEDSGQVYLYISSPVVIQSETYFFTTIKDITSIYEVRGEQLMFFSVVGPIVSVVVAAILLFVSRMLTSRINKLRRSTRLVSEGQYHHIDIRSKDEVGQLAGDFNRMSDAIQQKIGQLESVAEERKNFIDNMTHEMKTPLTSIIGFSDLLCNARLDEETVHDYAESIYKEGKYLKAISSKLMELILLRQPPTFKPVEVEGLLQEIYEAEEPIAANRKVRLCCEPVGGRITIDRELIKSLLYNLIDNAIKASPENGLVTLSARKTEDKRLEITVSDEGHGIPKEEQKRIFEPFYRVDKARSRKSGGAGLGLALCAEIAKKHRAELVIDSTPGKGTAVTVRFPEEKEVTP